MRKALIKTLEGEYGAIAPTANRLLEELQKQLKELLGHKNIPLAAPIECRLKSWPSIKEKLKRKGLTPRHIIDLNDLIGIRLILLFRRDVEKASQLLTAHFKVIEREDTSQKLMENQFGYDSLHFIVKLHKNWLNLPTLGSMKALKIEIQLRTMTQHIWASASHIIQYKQEAGIPTPLRRAVHGVSALLEQVDEVFDRVLAEKERHLKSLKVAHGSKTIGVSSLRKIMNAVLPKKNKIKWEYYKSLVGELHEAGFRKQTQVERVLRKYLEQLKAYDQARVKEEIETNFKSCYGPIERERVQRGIFYCHTDLLRHAIDLARMSKATAASNDKASDDQAHP